MRHLKASLPTKQFEYDYDYVPPLAMIKTVPGLGFTLGWALSVLLVALRLLINLIAVEINKDLKTLDNQLSQIVQAIENGNYLNAAELFLSVVAEIIEADQRAKALEQQALAVLEAVVKENLGEARQDLITLFETLSELLTSGLPAEAATSLDDYKNLFKTLPLPAIADTFQSDSVFAHMRVAGPNPLVITKLTGSLAKFPVSNAQFQSVMGIEDDLGTAISQGRVYIADYAILDWVVDGSYLTYQKHLWAPIAMFAVPQGTAAGRHLQVVAIQVQQQPGADNPIFVRPRPDTQSVEWEKAKTVVQIADGNFHEAISHLGQTHLVVEPFVIATLNQLDGHAVSRLLMPHFEGTLFINNAAQAKLIAPGGTVDAIFGGTIDSSRVAAVKGAQAILFDFGASSVPELLARRGVDDQQQLPYYPYRDIAVALWDAILAWTTDYVAVQYATEDGPANDKMLQNWVAELISHEGGRVKNVGEMTGGHEIIATRSHLAKILAIIIFTASAQHSAVNFPQASIMAFAPAMPLAGYAPVPSEGPWLATLPPLDQAVTQLNIGTLLGSVHYTTLGRYGDGYFTDPQVKNALTKFQTALGAVEDNMKKNGLDKIYPYLLPSLIPQSINI